MDISIVLARIWGWFFVVMTVTYLLGGKAFMRELLRMHKDKSFVFFSGWVLVLLGLVTIVLHNLWVADSRVLVTIVGWASLIKGITRIAFIEQTEKLTLKFFQNKFIRFQVAMIAVGLIGLWLVLIS